MNEDHRFSLKHLEYVNKPSDINHKPWFPSQKSRQLFYVVVRVTNCVEETALFSTDWPAVPITQHPPSLFIDLPLLTISLNYQHLRSHQLLFPSLAPCCSSHIAQQLMDGHMLPQLGRLSYILSWAPHFTVSYTHLKYPPLL